MTESRDLTPRDPRTPEEIAAASRPGAAEAVTREEHHREAAPGAWVEEEPGPVIPELAEEDVRRWLDRIGKLIAWVAGRFSSAPELEPPGWRFTTEELAELTPPATRVINRRALWLAGVIRNADEIELGFLLLEYVDANLERVRRAREAEEGTAAQADTRADLEEGAPERGPGSFGIGDE